MIFLLAVLSALQALTLLALLWIYRRHLHCVPVKDYSQLADCYLDALLEVVKSNSKCDFSDELPLT